MKWNVLRKSSKKLAKTFADVAKGLGTKTVYLVSRKFC
jgi:hypothetical protein